jgi:hypothetical protein
MLSNNAIHVPEPYLKLAAVSEAAHIGRGVDGGLAAYEAALADDLAGRRKPILTGWASLDHVMGGLWTTLLTILFGVAGHAKSWLALNLLYRCICDGVPAKLLPLEDSGEAWLSRLLSLHCNLWSLLKRDDSGNQLRANLFNLHRDFMATTLPYICENPRRPMPDGRVGDVPYESVLDFVRDEISGGTKLIVIDPLSMLDFSDDGRDFQGQAEFIKKLAGIIADSEAHVVLVCHAAKTAGPNKELVLEGSDRLRRFSQNVLRLERHETTESKVFGPTPMVEHDLTLSVTKCRNGLTGTRIAMRFSGTGPRLTDLGMLKPKGKL